MKIYKYGITLKRITHDDIELLRKWRNSETVNSFMEYRDYITVEMQERWFESVNNYDNFYYIIIYKGKKVGLINDKNVERGKSAISEAGLFIAEEKYRNTHIPLLASLMMIELNLFILKGEISYIHVLKDNAQAIAYNKSLGYKLCDGQEDVENQKYYLTPDNFDVKTAKIRKAASRLNDKKYPNGYVLFEKIDYELGIAQKFEELVKTAAVNVIITKVPEGTMMVY